MTDEALPDERCDVGLVCSDEEICKQPVYNVVEANAAVT